MSFSEGLKAAWDYKAPRPWDWRAITEDDADYCLGVLPPIYFAGGFAVSEPAIHDAQDRPVYLCVKRERGRLFAKLAAIHEVDPNADDWRARE